MKIINSIDRNCQKYKFNMLHESILPRTLFGIESDFVSKNEEKVRLFTGIDSFDKDREIKILTNDKAGKAGRAKWFVIDKNDLPKGQDNLNMWKVIVSSANAGGQKRDNQLEIVDPFSAFGRSRVALKLFDSKQEAENFYKYMKSYLVRYSFLMTDESLTSLGKRVPDLADYSNKNKYINFDQPLDDQLYNLFGINLSEQKYIEKNVDERKKRKADR